MKLKKYIRDKLVNIILLLVVEVLLFMLFFAFKIAKEVIITTLLIITIGFLIAFIVDFFKKKNFYDILETNLNRLDKKYLILETIPKASFYEGDILYKTMYEVNKSMMERLNIYKHSINDFKDYIEMWIHEVKIPIATLLLMNHNNEDKLERKYTDQIQRLDDYTEQVLYYVRSENAEKDYLIKKINLSKIIGKVAMKNKDYLLLNNIDLKVNNINHEIYTDSKWLEFILNQIISNSIKYKKEKNSYIKIYGEELKDKVILNIYDNGIGISKNDVKKVFQKSFTGDNGRVRAKSTGMGLYIAKNLSDKLGHKIDIKSVQGEYTNVQITFTKNDYYTFES